MPTSDYVKLTEDRHQQALYRLAAVGQYLYDTMNGDAESDRDTPDPLPLMSMEKVREVQRLIDEAIKHGQRTRRECLGGQLVLQERLPRKLPPVYSLSLGRPQASWIPKRTGLRVGRRRVGGFFVDLGVGSLYLFRRREPRWHVGRRVR